MVITTTSEEKVVVTKYMCEICTRVFTTVEMAEHCESRCRDACERRRLEQIKAIENRERLITKALDRMPKISQADYEREAISMAISYAPPIIPCLGCGHPKLVGYECMHLGCPGEPDEVLDIDTDYIFQDDAFELSDRGWNGAWPTDKKD